MTFAIIVDINGHDIVDIKLKVDFSIHLSPIQKVHREAYPLIGCRIPGQVK